ncbi:MAG: DegT/DnrJ/EryC1/StrS family aminotransferase, partial [Actinomycetota bacterium]|nr:DegT/DnrJ/EryC1/StrS family aminotransferase [Actinomycetota bacterium]
YRAALANVPGIAFPVIRDGDRSTYKDLTILADPAEFGMGGAPLAAALTQEGIETRRYYVPAVHEQQAYASSAETPGGLPETARVGERVVTLPLWIGMTDDDVTKVAEAIRRVHLHAGEILKTGG